LLSREVATSMRGRAMEALIHPFSFREYLRHLNSEPKKDVSRLTKSDRSELEKNLRDYLLNGGFPETVGLNPRDRFDLLRGYVDISLLRDVIERHKVSHPVALRWMIRHLLANAGAYFSVNKFYGDLKSQGLQVAKDTLHEYFSFLEDAFIIRTVSIASRSERRRMVIRVKSIQLIPDLLSYMILSGRQMLGMH